LPGNWSDIRGSELVIVGDRIFTDVALANRMRRYAPSMDLNIGPGTLAIWTTHVWEKEAMLMRWAERWLVKAVEGWVGRRSPSPFVTSWDEQKLQMGKFVKEAEPLDR